ncbi:hypothetical protein H2200_012746 [Cladophialophora chaetospira]|uniref:Major facilitator superfamily (MFS) profile domain-containing protein n=1 Tax=Cladophialophora chaetospira TaxID=386627 RepID=A0AA38WXG9_9EURO|nr:hypothetical protein H2200_012746 [Cladophialophora chaetospira]
MEDTKQGNAPNQDEEDVVSWADSPANPNNWSRSKKFYHTSICGITFMSSIYALGYKQIMVEFNVSSSVSLLGVSLFCLGLAFGPMIAAPLSETAGRLIIYRLSLPIATLFVIGSAVANNLSSILVCRFFAGFFGSPALSVGSGTLADIWIPRHRTRATAFFLMAPNLGPSLGQVIGGFVQEKKGWRWLEWVCVFAAVLTYAWAIMMRETYKKAILRTLEKAHPESNAVGPRTALRASYIIRALRNWIVTYLGRPLNMLATEPVVLFLSLYVALNFGILYNFFPSVPWSLARAYGFTESQSGLAFFAFATGCLFAGATCIGFDWAFKRKPLDNQDLEQILWPAMVACFGGPVALFWFAWTVRPDIHWVVPVCALIPFAWCHLCIFSAAVSYLVNIYGPTFGASASAGNSFARYAFAAAFPLFTVQSKSNPRSSDHAK